jgi:uncharacterized membrane protein
MRGIGEKIEREFELERLVFFSDAVFAIAITLLVVNITLEPGIPNADVPQAILGLLPRLAAFVLGFAVIGTFWIGHHRMFRDIERWDSRLIGWNMVLLFFIVIQPVTTSLLGIYGNLPLPAILYAVFLAGTGLAATGLWLHAYRAGLLNKRVTPRIARYRTLRAAIIPAVFLLSIPLAVVRPTFAEIFWLLMWPIHGVVRWLPGEEASEGQRAAQSHQKQE